MSPGNDLRFFVIIPVYGNWVDTIETLRALAKQECQDFRVLIADDGSPSEAPPEIHGFAFAEYLKQPNLGFGGNCNRAANIAIQQGATHLLFLNNDTDFSPEFIGTWLSTVQRLPHAIISPLIYWFNKPDAIWFSGGKMSLFIPYIRLSQAFSETTLVDIVCGCTLLVPVKEWKQLHGFDESFAVYFEDFDLSLRAKSAGIPTYVVPHAQLRVWHKVSGSFRGNHIWQQQYHLLTSRILFIRRYFRGLERSLSYGLTTLHLITMIAQRFPKLPNPSLLWNAAANGTAKSLPHQNTNGGATPSTSAPHLATNARSASKSSGR